MSNFLLKKVAVVASASIMFAATAPVLAVETLSIPAQAVRVQNYPTDVMLFYTGSPCQNGSLVLDPSDSPDRHKALLGTVLAAKSMSAALSFEYDIGGGRCVIRTFSVDGP